MAHAAFRTLMASMDRDEVAALPERVRRPSMDAVDQPRQASVDDQSRGTIVDTICVRDCIVFYMNYDDVSKHETRFGTHAHTRREHVI